MAVPSYFIEKTNMLSSFIGFSIIIRTIELGFRKNSCPVADLLIYLFIYLFTNFPLHNMNIQVPGANTCIKKFNFKPYLG